MRRVGLVSSYSSTNTHSTAAATTTHIVLQEVPQEVKREKHVSYHLGRLQ